MGQTAAAFIGRRSTATVLISARFGWSLKAADEGGGLALEEPVLSSSQATRDRNRRIGMAMSIVMNPLDGLVLLQPDLPEK